MVVGLMVGSPYARVFSMAYTMVSPSSAFVFPRFIGMTTIMLNGWRPSSRPMVRNARVSPKVFRRSLYTGLCAVMKGWPHRRFCSFEADTRR